MNHEHAREEDERRRALYENEEARRIVTDAAAAAGLSADWPLLSELYYPVLERVDEALNNDTPRDTIPALAAKWLAEEIARLGGR